MLRVVNGKACTFCSSPGLRESVGGWQHGACNLKEVGQNSHVLSVLRPLFSLLSLGSLNSMQIFSFMSWRSPQWLVRVCEHKVSVAERIIGIGLGRLFLLSVAEESLQQRGG